MSAIAYTRFDPRAALQNRNRTEAAAKSAEAAKPGELAGEEAVPFATFATFAAEPTGKQTLAPASEEDWGEAHEERAGIIEHDGLAPRAWAEAFARLDPARPPGDIPPKRWLRFIDDCGHFLDNGWALSAAELGWTPFDLFGCDRSKPFARVGRSGLLWLLDGRQLRALTAETALISTPSGSSLTFYRRPHEPGRVLAWELAP
jgi:hypothetical protein